MSIASRIAEDLVGRWVERLSDHSQAGLGDHAVSALKACVEDLASDGISAGARLILELKELQQQLDAYHLDIVPAGWEELVSVKLGEIRALRRKSDGATVTGRVDVDGKGRVDVLDGASAPWDVVLWVMRRPWNDRG